MSSAFSLLCVLTLATALVAQENPLVKDHPGAWSVTGPVVPSFPSEVKAPDRPAVSKVVNQLIDILRRTPEFAPPTGFQTIPYAKVSGEEFNQAPGTARIFYAGEFIRVNVAPWERKGAAVAANERDTAASVEIRVNTLDPLLGSEIGDEWKDEQGAFLRNFPQPGDNMHGHPVYESGNQKWILLFRGATPVVAPVSRERYMNAKIHTLEARLAKAQKTRSTVPAGLPASVTAALDEGIGALQKAIQEDQRQLASMSADQRKAAAFVESDREDQTAAFSDGPDNAITYFNPALMDARLGIAMPQILAISITSDEEHWPGLAEKVAQELDWGALEKFVKQP